MVHMNKCSIAIRWSIFILNCLVWVSLYAWYGSNPLNWNLYISVQTDAKSAGNLRVFAQFCIIRVYSRNHRQIKTHWIENDLFFNRQLRSVYILSLRVVVFGLRFIYLLYIPAHITIHIAVWLWQSHSFEHQRSNIACLFIAHAKVYVNLVMRCRIDHAFVTNANIFINSMLSTW